MAALTVIRVATDKGDLVIEANDDVEVALKQGGKQVQVLDTRTGRKFTIQAGEYDAEVTELPDGVKVATKHFKLIRGGREVLTVSMAPVNPPPMQRADASAAGAFPPKLTVDLGDGVKMEFVLIDPKSKPDGGKFKMGSPPGEEGREGIEGPQHEVEITRPYYLGVGPVTKGQFTAFVQDDHYGTNAETDGRGGCGFNAATRKYGARDPKYTWRNTGWEQTDAHPVVNVTWNDAEKFCVWLSRKTGRTCELPTEAEWEYACRAGTATRFWCGDTDESLKGHANIPDASLQAKWQDFGWVAAWDDGYPFTSPVGSFQANPWGLYDMGGNVWQWCADRYGEYREEHVKDPKGASNGKDRVIRGGWWGSMPHNNRSASRGGLDPGYCDGNGGFRVVLRVVRHSLRR